MIALWGAAALLLVLASALLSAAARAVTSIGSGRLRTLVEEGFEGASTLARIRAGSTSLQAAHLLVASCNLAAAGLAAALGAYLDGVRGSLLALLLAVPLILFVSDVVPRALAARRPIRIALASAPALLVLDRAVGGLLAPVLRLQRLLAGRSGAEGAEEREVRELADLGREEGVVDHEEHALVERAFRLDELTAFDVMTPRVDVFAWKDATRLADIIPQLATVPYSRVPVYGASIDDVTGILYVREAYETWVAGRREATLGTLAREPFFVPGTMPLAQLLRDFQARRIHMGIVADEYGGTDGLVTLEDVLEELVGEIVDETDVDEEPLLRVGPDALVADGAVDLRELNYAFNVSLPTVENRSLNGFILDELGYVPEPGESLRRSGVEIEVLEASDTQVLRARLVRASEPGEDDEDEG